MNAVELLMGMDAGAIEQVPQGKMEIKRLSKLAGAPFVVEYKAISGRKYSELAALATDRNGNNDVRKGYDMNLMILANAITSPDLNNKDLKDKFKAPTPKELADKIFNPGEVGNLVAAILKLSGLGEDEETDEEIKN